VQVVNGATIDPTGAEQRAADRSERPPVGHLGDTAAKRTCSRLEETSVRTVTPGGAGSSSTQTQTPGGPTGTP
jgi:hypothetical protein